jgi:hypothetical protein
MANTAYFFGFTTYTHMILYVTSLKRLKYPGDWFLLSAHIPSCQKGEAHRHRSSIKHYLSFTHWTRPDWLENPSELYCSGKSINLHSWSTKHCVCLIINLPHRWKEYYSPSRPSKSGGNWYCYRPICSLWRRNFHYKVSWVI